jgi:hypothetical protein
MLEKIKLTNRAQAILIYWSWTFATIYFLAFYFLIKLFPFPSATLPSPDVAHFYQQNSLSIRIGAAICAWTGAFSIPFTITVSVQMARLEKGFPIWSIVQLCGGVMLSIFAVLPPMFWGVAAFSPGRIADVTAALHEFGNLSVLATDQYFIFQNIGVAVMCLTRTDIAHSPFPRWLGYLSIFSTFSIEVGVAAFLFKTGPFAWNGLFVFWIPIVLFGVWYTALSNLIIFRLKKQ